MEIIEEIDMDTPYGKPSDKIVIGRINNSEPVAFLPRHGRGHRIMPSEINSRANIYALKLLGVERIIAVSAVGSLKEEIHPGDIVIPDQLIDKTKGRPFTFFGDGIVAHVAFADPFCPELRNLLITQIEELKYKVHKEGIYVCMEGPQFSTRAESFLHRSWGASVIGMTALPEAKLAREAEICYAIMAMPTDYDCWHEVEEDVTADMVVKQMEENIKKAKEVIKNIIFKIPEERNCICKNAAENAIVTDLSTVPFETLRRLEPLYGKYFKK